MSLFKETKTCCLSLLTGCAFPQQGSDCVNPFVLLQSCIKTHPDAFSKDILDDEEVEKEVNPSTEPKIVPPRWALESQDTKSKL